MGTKKTLKSERKADDVDARDASNPQVRTPSLPHRVRNGDARDASNPQAVTEYVNDMYAHFREKELETSVHPSVLRP